MNDGFELNGLDVINLSYGHFMAFDSAEPAPGSLWTDQHVKQGFVRRACTIGFRTLAEFGPAQIRVLHGTSITLDTYERVVSVPLEVPSGILCLEGPMEYPIERTVYLAPGVFRLNVAQTMNEEGRLRIDVYIEEVQVCYARSMVLKADQDLDTCDELSETGEVA